MKKTIKAVKPLAFINNAKALVAIFSKVKELDELNQRVSHYLDNNLRSYCKVANVIANRLILVTANSSVATMLRLQSSDLLQKFKYDPLLKNICYIHCKISPTLQTTMSNKLKIQKMVLLSHETAKVMQEIAQTINDPKLRAIMLKIATHTDEKKP